MSFNTALSGLNAASIDLNVTSNNIANVSTVGFKSAKAEFGDYFQVTPFGVSSTAVGAGVKVNAVNQNFGQGNLDFTDNSLDLAISGNGFFITGTELTGGDIAYTRAGQFNVDNQGYITNSVGRFLQTFPIDVDGNVTSTAIDTLVPLQLTTTIGQPSATTDVDFGANLDASEPGAPPATFDPTDISTFTHSTSTTVYDSLGVSHILTYYFVADSGTANQWAVFPFVDGVTAGFGGAGTVTGAGGEEGALISFNPDGTFNSTNPAALSTTVTAATLGTGAADLVFATDLANSGHSQFASPFSVSTFAQDGFTSGRLTGIDVGTEGLIQASFSNGAIRPLGQIAFASFPSEQGLQDIGDAQWEETTASGQVVTGVPGTGSNAPCSSSMISSLDSRP